jgi:hypothetical protein
MSGAGHIVDDPAIAAACPTWPARRAWMKAVRLNNTAVAAVTTAKILVHMWWTSFFPFTVYPPRQDGTYSQASGAAMPGYECSGVAYQVVVMI